LIGRTGDIESSVLGSAQYPTINAATSARVVDWWQASRAALEGIGGATRPNDLATELGESLLDAFRSHRLLDEYAVYEQLMSYWNTSMHDDVALIVGEGWEDAAKPRAARTWKDKNNKTKYEDAHLVFGTGANAKRWVMDLIPPHLIIGRYFAAEQAEVEKLNADLEATAQAIEEYTEEHAVEDGLLWEAVEDDKITAATVKKRLRIAKAEKAEAEELAALNHITKLYAVEAAAKKAVKDAAAKLDEKALAQYGTLTTNDIKTLVIDDRWGATIAAGISAELVTSVQRFTARLGILADRYEATMASLDAAIAAGRTKVEAHLAAMGVIA
jgi:type I restriction enzyme M protein